MADRILVCGGRVFDTERVWTALDGLDKERGPFTIVIHGNYGDTDRSAGAWAIANNRLVRWFDPDWNKHGKAAGPIRNQRMLDEGKPDLVIAFEGGKGTADMMKRARKAGVEVIEVTHG